METILALIGAVFICAAAFVYASTERVDSKKASTVINELESALNSHTTAINEAQKIDEEIKTEVDRLNDALTEVERKLREVDARVKNQGAKQFNLETRVKVKEELDRDKSMNVKFDGPLPVSIIETKRQPKKARPTLKKKTK